MQTEENVQEGEEKTQADPEQNKGIEDPQPDADKNPNEQETPNQGEEEQ